MTPRDVPGVAAVVVVVVLVSSSGFSDADLLQVSDRGRVVAVQV